jgi:hypothetical protein
MARKSAADLRSAKEKKQKKIAAVLGVLFLIVLAIQAPRMMKMMSSGEPVATPTEPAVTTTGSESDPSLAPPTLEEPNPTALPASATPVETSSLLVSFSRFESKDPFQQQVKTTVGDGGASAGQGDGGGDGDAAEEPDGMLDTDSDGGKAAPAPGPGAAGLSVNGVFESIKVGESFPEAAQMFVLLTVRAKSATIGVSEGGGFSSGGEKLALELGKPVTLVNTADGTRFVVELKSVA